MEMSLSVFAKAGGSTYKSVGFFGRTDRLGSNALRIAVIAAIIGIITGLTVTRVSNGTKGDRKNHHIFTEARSGLNVALPDNMRDFPIEELLPQP